MVREADIEEEKDRIKKSLLAFTPSVELILEGSLQRVIATAVLSNWITIS